MGMDSRHVELAPCARKQAPIVKFVPRVQGHGEDRRHHTKGPGRGQVRGRGASYLPCWLAYSRDHHVNDAEAEDLVVKLDIDLEVGPQLTLPTKSLETCRRGCTLQRMAGIWTTLLLQIYSMGQMVRLPRASPRPGHPPHTVRPWMWPNVQTRAVQGPCARRGMDDVRVQSCHSVVGPHTSKEQVSAHARRGRVGVIVVRRLEGESAIEGSPDFLPRI